MRALQICKKFPYPAKDGESVAVLAISRGLAKAGVEIDLLAMNTSKHFVALELDAGALDHYRKIRTIFVENSVDPFDAFFNLFTSKSYNIQRFISKPFEEQLLKMLTNSDYDIIQLESLYIMPYIKAIRKHSDARVVMRSHNLEYEIWQNLSQEAGNPLLKWYYSLCASRLKSFEMKYLDLLDSIIFISGEDAAKYREHGYTGRYHVTPVGFDVEKHISHAPKRKYIRKLGYIGSLDWKPNIEGVSWFLQNAWPRINDEFPDIEFHLAGRNASQSLLSKIPSEIFFHGEVDSAPDFIDQLDILIVPLFSGSGIRVKILESMAMSKVVFSTAKGFEGIDFTHTKNAFLFETVEELIEGLRLCMQDQDYFLMLKTNARKLILNKFDFATLSSELISHYNQIM